MKTCSICFLVVYVDVLDSILIIKDFVSNGASKAIDNSRAVIISKLIWKFGFHICIMQNIAHPEKLKTFILKIKWENVLWTWFRFFGGAVPWKSW